MDTRLPLNEASASVETLVEALDASAGIDQLLLTREERVALGADFNLQLLLGRAGGEGLAAYAADDCFAVLGMDAFLHDFHLFRRDTIA